MKKIYVFVPLNPRFWMYHHDPIRIAFSHAEDIYGEFYTFTQKYIYISDPVKCVEFIGIEAIPKVKPMLTERLEYWIDLLN